MKKVIGLFAAICSMIFLIPSFSGAAAPIVIKWGDAQPKTYAYWPAMQAFKAEVERKTGGKVDIQLYGDGILGNSGSLLESTLMGSIQMVSTSASSASSNVPELEACTLPMIWPSSKVFSDFTVSSVGQKMINLFEKKGLKCLTWCFGGWVGVQNSKREVRTPADLKGLKIRVLQNPIMIDTMNAMGGMGVSMGSTEVYSAAQQGVIDGATTSPQLLYALKLHEVCKYYTPLNVHISPVMTIINLKFWNSLPPDIQQAMKEAANTWKKVVEDYHFDATKETSDQRIMEMYKKSGVKITEPDVNAFRNVTKPVVTKYREKLGPELVDPILKFVNYEGK